MTRSRTPRTLLALLAAMAFGAAACGSDASDTSASEDADTTEATAEDTSDASDGATDGTEDEMDGEMDGEGDGEMDGEEHSDDALTVGFLPPGLEIPAFQGLLAGLEGYGGGRYGDTIEAVDAAFDPVVQAQTIDTWVELDQVDAIWIIPAGGEAVADSLLTAAESGIPIVAAGVPEDYGWDGLQENITFANIDNVAFGGGVGELMAACVNERLGGEAEVLYMGSDDPATSTEQINSSSLAALADGAPGATVLDELIAVANDVAGTQQVIESALQANPTSNAFMAGDAEATMAALNVYTAAGMDAQEICIVGNGGTDDQLAAVEAGEVFGVVAFDFEADLMQNLDELHRLAAAPGEVGEQLTIPINVVSG